MIDWYRGVEGDAALVLVDAVRWLGNSNPREIRAEELHLRLRARAMRNSRRIERMRER